MSIDLEQLAALEQAATPGPWAVEDLPWIAEGNDGGADAALIVAARNALPELLERVREAEVERRDVVRMSVPTITLQEFDRLEARAEAAEARVAQLEAALERWTSGRRRLGLPRIETLRDGLGLAARLVRSSTGDDDVDALMRDAALTLKEHHDAIGPLIHDRQTAESRVAELEDGIKALVEGAVTADFGGYVGDELNEDLALGVRESDLSALLNGTDKDTE